MTGGLNLSMLTKLKICSRCNGEGELRVPPYGIILEGKWVLPLDWNDHVDGGSNFRQPIGEVGLCKVCNGTGWLKCL